MTMTPEQINELLAKTRDQKFRKLTEGRINQANALKGRARPDQSARMTGSGNSMAKKAHPNKGKIMPQIGDKTRGRAKPEGFGAKISLAKKGVPNLNLLGKKRPEHSKKMKEIILANGGVKNMQEKVTCQHCGKISNQPNYFRWHGDKCKALKNKD
jgi:hypothetical protein